MLLHNKSRNLATFSKISFQSLLTMSEISQKGVPTNDPKNIHDMTAFVQQTLTDMQNKFTNMSDQVRAVLFLDFTHFLDDGTHGRHVLETRRFGKIHAGDDGPGRRGLALLIPKKTSSFQPFLFLVRILKYQKKNPFSFPFSFYFCRKQIYASRLFFFLLEFSLSHCEKKIKGKKKRLIDFLLANTYTE